MLANWLQCISFRQALAGMPRFKKQQRPSQHFAVPTASFPLPASVSRPGRHHPAYSAGSPTDDFAFDEPSATPPVVTTIATTAMTNVDTTFTAASATLLYIGQRISVVTGPDTEVMIITNIVGTTITVLRAQDLTTAVAHNIGDSVKWLFDSGRIFRFFGDANGDGTVAADDFIQFRLSLGGTNPIFDFDGDSAVAASDFIQFRLRFGGSI